eukprot:3939872-Pleurochrysis_carterae.AAC.2
MSTQCLIVPVSASTQRGPCRRVHGSARAPSEAAGEERGGRFARESWREKLSGRNRAGARWVSRQGARGDGRWGGCSRRGSGCKQRVEKGRGPRAGGVERGGARG